MKSTEKNKKKDIEEINKVSTNIERMNKYKPKAEQRLKSENINPSSLRNSKGEYTKYYEITLDYYLEHGYRKIFLTREKNLSGIQKLRINQIFREFDYNGYLVETRTIKNIVQKIRIISN